MESVIVARSILSEFFRDNRARSASRQSQQSKQPTPPIRVEKCDEIVRFFCIDPLHRASLIHGDDA